MRGLSPIYCGVLLATQIPSIKGLSPLNKNNRTMRGQTLRRVDCSIRCGPAGKRNSSVSSRSTWFALGLAIHHGSLSRVTCWLPKMILPGRQGRRRCWCEWLAVSGRGPGNGQAYPIASAFWCGIARQCLVKQFEIRLQYPNDVEECTRYFRDWS